MFPGAGQGKVLCQCLCSRCDSAAGGSGGSGVPAARVVEGLDLSARQGFILEQRWQLSLLENVVSGNGIVLRLCMENV